MKDALQRLLEAVGVWCLERSGRRTEYADYLYAVGEATKASEEAERARNATGELRGKLMRLLEHARLVDGLLSTNQPERAHQTLRVGIIAAGGLATTRRAKPREESSHV